MASFATQSTLFKLIEAGQLARLTLALPLRDLGLETGDDAVLLAIAKRKGTSLARLRVRTGLTGAPLEARLSRLEGLNLIDRGAISGKQGPGVMLSKKGRALRRRLANQWNELNTALSGDLTTKDHKHLRHTLKRFVSRFRI